MIHEEAMAEIKRCTNSHFDEKIVRAFLQTPVGRGEDEKKPNWVF